MSTANNDDEASRQSSAWLDADDDRQSAMESEVSADQQARVADLQLVDALLSNLSGQASHERAARIGRVMATINANEPTPGAKRQTVRLRSAVAIAASLMIACGFLWAQFVRQSRANVILREIGEVTLEKIDRIYHLRRDASASGTGQKSEGKLYLRGRDGFVLRCGGVVLGRSRDEYWLVPRHGKIVLADSFEWMVSQSEREAGEIELLKQLAVDSRKVPIMQLSAVVELMKHDYEVSLHRQQRHDQSIDAIVGTLREDAANLPDKISLWADATSRIIHRAEFRWGPGNTLILELAPAEPVPVNWYQHGTHHDTQRGVRRVSRKS